VQVAGFLGLQAGDAPAPSTVRSTIATLTSNKIATRIGLVRDDE